MLYLNTLLHFTAGCLRNRLIATALRCARLWEGVLPGDCSRGTAAGKYAGQPLKAGAAAQPKGCSACFVPFGYVR